MFRYVAVIWNDRNEADAVAAARLLKRMMSTSRDLRASFECPGMRVLCNARPRTPSGPCHLSGESGVVLGTLFAAPLLMNDSYSTRLTALRQQDSHAIVGSAGRELVNKFWGRYVAFINDPRRDAKLVVRDPMGGLPCFVCKHQGVTVVFSHLGDCLSTGLLQFSLNWRHIAARVALGSWQLSETGLEGCMELHPGHSLRISKDGSNEIALWEPLAAAARDPLDDLNVAARNLRAMVQSCANSWASCYDNLLTDISGGLDSAIVAACLARAPSRPKVTALKFSAQTASGETQRARLVADRLGYEFLDLELERRPIATTRLLSADPTANLELDVGVCEAVDAKMHLARERGAVGMFDGSPGDVLFGATTKEFGAIDYIHRHGLDKRALKVALDVALMTDRSWWDVISEALRKPKPMSARDLAAATMGYRHLPGEFARQIVDQKPDLISSMVPMSNGAPGILEFLTIFTGGAQFYNPFGSALRAFDADPEPVSILRSQPLVELCLRIPPYVKNAGARDRWVARLAFMDDLPTEITSTLWKDPAPNGTHERLLRSMESVRELLSDGILVKEKMLDQQKLRDALTFGAVRRPSFPSEVHDHIVAELWVRRMTRALEESRRPEWPAAAGA